MKSTFRILFYLKKNEPKKNGNVVIMVRITVDGENTQFSSKLDIYPDMWDTKNGKAIGRTAQASNLNRLLDNIRANISMHYTRLMDGGGYASPEKIKNAFLGIEEKGKTIIHFFTQHNELYKQRVGKTTSYTTYTRYELAKQRLIEFLKAKYSVSDMQISEINLIFIERFELYMRTEYKNGNNNAMKFVQRLRTIILFAKNMGATIVDPFSNYKIHWQKADRGYLTEQEIHLLMQKKFTIKRLEQVRDVFLFSCFTGLSYIDVKNLAESNIRKSFDNKTWVMTKRQKTGIDVNVPLLEIPRIILSKYEGKLPNGLLLPILTNQKMNAYLKEIGELCEIDKSLTYHLARHSFATLSLTKGVPIETVSKMLGHTNITTTQIYARIIDTKISDDMQVFADKLQGVEKMYSQTI